MTDIQFITKELKYYLNHDVLEFKSNINIHELINKAEHGIEHKKNEEVEGLLVEYIKLRQYSHSDIIQNIEYVDYPNGSESYIDKVHDMVIIEISSPNFIWKEDKENFSMYLNSLIYVTKGF